MATKIKLMRLGKTRAPYYRIVVADARTRRNGRAIETIGKYHPKRDPSFMEVESDRALYWLGVGAQPTEAVEAILKVTGDWQKFKGLPAPEPMRTAAPKADRRAIFEQAAKEASTDDSSSGAPDTPRKKRPAKLEPKADAEPKSGADSKSGGDSKSGADPRADADSSTTTSGTSGPSGPSAAEATPDAGADSLPAASGAGAATTDSTPAASGAGAATTDSTPAASDGQ